MNAFKKELAGILLDSNQTNIAMQNVVEEIDYVLKNWEKQMFTENSISGWDMFLVAFYERLGANIQESVDIYCEENISNIFFESIKEITRLYIFLTKYHDDDIGKEMLFEGIEGSARESYIEFYNSLEKEIFA